MNIYYASICITFDAELIIIDIKILNKTRIATIKKLIELKKN